MNDKDFAPNLRAVMGREGVTNKSLADDTGISSRLISKYRTGEKLPSWRNLKRIKNALGCNISELV
jgi:transcriptional regulator with XRE-family HTH domain